MPNFVFFLPFAIIVQMLLAIKCSCVTVFFGTGLCDGRVLQYNMESKEIRTVMSGLCFANGIQLSEDEKLLFVSETLRNRIRVIDTTNWETKRFVNVPRKKF